MNMNNKNIFTAILLLMYPIAKADLVGVYLHEVDKTLVLDISLSNTTKAEVETGPSECEKKGMWRVFMQIAAAGYYPRMLPYASGCWYVKSNLIYIEAKTIEDNRFFSVRYPVEKFKTMPGFTTWGNFYKYKPISIKEAEIRKQLEEENSIKLRQEEEYKELVSWIEGSMKCNSVPHPNRIMYDLERKNFTYNTGLGSKRIPIYKTKKDIFVFGQKLIFLSGGGADGSYEDFKSTPRLGQAFITTHLAITLDDMPDEESFSIKRPQGPSIKSSMLFLKDGALDGSNSGVTLVCGHKPKSEKSENEVLQELMGSRVF